MRLPAFAIALCLYALLPSGCATSRPDIESKAVLLQANRAWAEICGKLADDHAAGKIVGEAFNKKRENCLAADVALDLGDLAAVASALAAAEKD